MTRIRPHVSPGPAVTALEHRLAVAADRAGDADGQLDRAELVQLVAELESRPRASFDTVAEQRLQTARAMLAGPDAKLPATLEPALRALPEAVRRLALEVDGLWGDGDGQISVAEIDRVARYYLAVLPYFSTQATQLLELARALHLDQPSQAAVAPSVVALRAAVARLDGDEAQQARPFGALFAEALVAAEIPGAPELLRSALRHSPRWHRLSILEHTAVAVDAAQALARQAGQDAARAGATLLLHDVGKVLTRHARERHGEVQFNYWDHEEVGARWLASRAVDPEIVFQVRHHLDIHEQSSDQLIALADGDPARVAQMLVVALADSVAKGDTPHQLASFDQLRPKLLELAAFAGVDGPALLARADALRQARFG